MKNRIQLLDIVVDLASTKTASDTTIRYLNEENSKVIYFLSSETLLLLQANQEWKKIVAESDLILPGTSSVDESIDEALGHQRESFFVEEYFEKILDRAIEEGHEILLVAEDEKKFVSIQENIHERRPFLDLSGIFLDEKENSLDHIVNGINSVAPDILLIALDEENQLKLLHSFRDQMNARVMLFLGGILYNKAISEAEVPDSIKKLRITNFYKWILKGGRIKSFFNNRKMKRELKQHKRD